MSLHQEDAFVVSILESPEDDTPWHIYSDWLEERGDSRAVLLRVLREWLRLPPGHPRRQEREDILLELLDCHGGLAASLRRLCPGWSPLSSVSAVLLFLHARTDPGEASDDAFRVGSLWRGDLRQGIYRFPTTLRVQSRSGNTFRGALRENFASMYGGQDVQGTFNIEGVFLPGHLAFLSGKIIGAGTGPGLYLATVEGRKLLGTWQVPPGMNGTFDLALVSQQSRPAKKGKGRRR
jgi:uncharacterized protein (TIGR02996 family)